MQDALESEKCNFWSENPEQRPRRRPERFIFKLILENYSTKM
jgi:hypothetical protein